MKNYKEYFSIFPIILSSIFLFAASSKLLDWSNVYLVLSKFGFTNIISIILGILLILFEFILGILFLIPKTWKFPSISCIFIVILFSIIAFYGKYQGIITSCPCFGRFFSSQIGFSLIIRNTILIFISFIIWILTTKYSDLVDFGISIRIYKVCFVLIILINVYYAGRIIGTLI